jgi:hypothetical protein
MKSHKVLVIGAVLLAVIAVGILSAQKAEAPTVEKKVMKMEKGGTCPGMGGMEKGMDMPGMMMPDLPPDIEKKVLDLQIKFIKETASLNADLAQKHLEMRQLWLDDEPNADKIVAKMNEIAKVQMQLHEKGIRNRLAVYGLMPKEMRKGFLRGCCGGMRAGMGMMQPGMGMCGGMCGGMGGGMNMGPGGMGGMGMGRKVQIEKRVIKNGSDSGDDEE